MPIPTLEKPWVSGVFTPALDFYRLLVALVV